VCHAASWNFSRAMSINKLFIEPATVILANHDAKERFETRATRGTQLKRTLNLLELMSDELRMESTKKATSPF
jgi:hypothetical protein